MDDRAAQLTAMEGSAATDRGRGAGQAVIDRIGGLNEHGLWVSQAAALAIQAFRREGHVGNYPMYLVGLALPEHRGGPAIVALLTMPDGGVIDASARSCQKKTRINGLIEFDVYCASDEDLRDYRRIFYQDFGGFIGAGCLEASPTVVAENLLSNVRRGLDLGPLVGPSPMGPPGSFPSDWTDVVFYTDVAVGCTVEGFAPSTDTVAELADVPAALNCRRLLEGRHLSDGVRRLHWCRDRSVMRSASEDDRRSASNGARRAQLDQGETADLASFSR